ncbi:alkaline phosphatase family protein [Penicillium brasilianum]|uniref:Alkaline phosphatase family protein n=1 Tax=Penicillium brasilianum TaxID=104259 RepID=A0A1S9RJU7_PENBI|nr:alkaline phosphatase family protein [Penicillium brasilianum]
MASLPRLAAATSSTVIRLFGFIFLRWIPGHHFVPIIFTSLAVYLASLVSLGRDDPLSSNRAKKNQKSSQSTRGSKVVESGDSVLKTLLTGLPSRRSRLSTWTTALINIAVALLTLDFLVRGLVLYPSTNVSFSRIGHVSPTTAKLLLREPDQSQLPVVISFQEATVPSQKWTQEGTVYKLDNSTDFTAAVTLGNLKPSTEYRYLLSNNKTGSFITAPRPGSPSANRLSFVTSSCIKPNFPYNVLSHPLRIPGIEQMTEALGKLPAILRPAFMLFLGDFVYIDVPFRFGSSMDHYRSEYRRIYSSPSWAASSVDGPAINLPWIHTLDDHEIENDWSQGNTTAPYPAAADPFLHYHVAANPPVPEKAFAHPDNVTYFSFVNGPASFFMLDTRTYRSEPSQDNSTILGSAQLQSLLAYLSAPEPSGVHWKIISSSVPFTKNWHIGTTDTWGGFLNERQKVFEAMWRTEQELGIRVVLLSGDRHEFGATRFPDPSLQLPASELQSETAGLGIHEFSVGPLSMFYLPVRSYYQTDDKDVSVKYAPDGNSKFGYLEIADGIDDVDPTASAPVPVRSSILTYSLYVDGEVVWKYQLSVPLGPNAGTQAIHDSGEKARLPPGRILEDKLVNKGWDVAFKTTIGSMEELARSCFDLAVAGYYTLLDRFQALERLD